MELLRESRRGEDELSRQLSEVEERLKRENVENRLINCELCALEQQYQGIENDLAERSGDDRKLLDEEQRILSIVKKKEFVISNLQSELTTLLKAEKTVHIQLMENIISTADEINMIKENWDALVIENRIKLNRHSKISS